MEVLGLKCERGSKAHGRVAIGELYDQSTVTLPIRIVRGAKDGPVVALTALIHGDEYNGMATINRLAAAIDPAELSGTIIGVVCANPLAYNSAERISRFEYERLNLNRIFPGNPDGFIAERLAHAIFENVIKQADYLLDFHEGGRDFMAKYLIGIEIEGVDDSVRQTSDDLARAFGLGIPTLKGKLSPERIRLGRAGTATIQASVIGKPALGVELGGGGTLWPEYVELGVTGTTNVLKHLGMLPGAPVQVARPQYFCRQSMWPRPRHGGILEQYVGLGDVVEAGQLVARVLDVFGAPIEELRSPYRAVILDIRHTAPILTGEWTVHCGRLE